MHPIDSKRGSKRRPRRFRSMPPAARRIHRELWRRYWNLPRTQRPADPADLLVAAERVALVNMGCWPVDQRYIFTSPADRRQMRRRRDNDYLLAQISVFRKYPAEMKDLLWSVLKGME